MKNNRLIKAFKFMHLPFMIAMLLVTVSCINGQKSENEIVAAIAPTKMNVMYIGVDNPLNIAVSGYAPDEIEVSITNGVIAGEKGKYIVKPRQTGIVTICLTVDGDTIQKTNFRVKTVPDPQTRLAGKQGGRISKEELLANPEMIAYMADFDFDLQFTITEFTISGVLKGMNHDIASKSNKLTNEQIEFIKQLSRGDRIYVTDIKCFGPDGAPRPLSTIDFVIMD